MTKIPENNDELFYEKRLKEFQEAGLTPIEIAKKMAELRNTKANLIPAVSDPEYLRSIYYRYFVTNSLNELKKQGISDFEIETRRIALELYVDKLMSMTSLERQNEFRRLDEERVQSVMSKNDQAIFQYLLAKDVVRKIKDGTLRTDDQVDYVRQKNIEFIIGLYDFSDKEKQIALAELLMRDQKSGTKTVVDPSTIPSTNEQLMLIKNQMDLEKINRLKRDK